MARRFRSQAFTLIELLSLIGIAAILAVLILPVIRTVQERGKEARCAGNLKSIGSAMQLYLQDHQMRLPIRFQRKARPRIGYKEDLAPYLGNDLRVFICPTHATIDFPTQPSYGMNYFYDQVLTLRTQNPSQTILLAETAGRNGQGSHRAHRDSETPGELAPERHRGRANYLFFDGAVRLLSREETLQPIDLWGEDLRGK